jgi:hypothetical protein
MSRHWMVLGCVLGAMGLAACGNTVGDPCTTADDCGGGLCINRGDETPGGYCSRQCVLNDPESCPSGSICVREGAGGNINACFLRCNDVGDCRRGYSCRTWKDSAATVCVAKD